MFGFLKGKNVELLKAQSGFAIAAFTETVNKLQYINKDIDNAIDIRNEALGKLISEANDLKDQKEKNEKFINKINSFLNE